MHIAAELVLQPALREVLLSLELLPQDLVDHTYLPFLHIVVCEGEGKQIMKGCLKISIQLVILLLAPQLPHFVYPFCRKL